MDLAALSVALVAFFAACLAYREAVRSSSRKLIATVLEAIEESERATKRLRRDWEEERDRLIKQARRTGSTLKRLDAILEDSSEGADGDESELDGVGDARGGAESQLRPVRQNVVSLPWRGGRTG